MYHVTCTLFSFPHINITSNFLSRRKTSKHNQGAKIFRTRFYNQIRIILNHKGDGSSSFSKLSSKEIAHLQVQIMIFGPFRPYSSLHRVHSIFITSLRCSKVPFSFEHNIRRNLYDLHGSDDHPVCFWFKSFCFLVL